MTAPAATDAEVLRQFRDVGLTLIAAVVVLATSSGSDVLAFALTVLFLATPEPWRHQ